MNQQKFEQIYRGLTVQAKKVYDSIPMVEAWSPAMVMQDLHRRNQSMGDMHVVLGCVNSLIACARNKFCTTYPATSEAPHSPPRQAALCPCSQP